MVERQHARKIARRRPGEGDSLKFKTGPVLFHVTVQTPFFFLAALFIVIQIISETASNFESKDVKLVHSFPRRV